MLTAVLTSPQEFGSSYAEVRARLGSSPEYRRWFRRAFGPSARIEPAMMAAALTGHNDEVWDARYCPNGRYAVSGA